MEDKDATALVEAFETSGPAQPDPFFLSRGCGREMLRCNADTLPQHHPLGPPAIGALSHPFFGWEGVRTLQNRLQKKVGTNLF